MNLLLRKPSRSAVVLLAIVLAACSAATIIGLITTGLQIAEAAAAITGVLPAPFVAYVSAALEGMSCASIEIASSDTAAQKYLKTTACFANAVAPTLPPGTAQNILNIVTKLEQAIQNILANLPKPPTDAKKALQPILVNDSDHAKLLALAARAQMDKAKFLAAHK